MTSVGVKRKRGRPRRDEKTQVNQFDVALIKEFQQRPAFYDRSHPQYRNREFLEPQWNEMAVKMGCSVAEVKERILQLRSRYNLEKRRSEGLQQQYDDPDITSKWCLYDRLSFLSDHIKARRPCPKDMVQVSLSPPPAQIKRSSNSSGIDELEVSASDICDFDNDEDMFGDSSNVAKQNFGGAVAKNNTSAQPNLFAQHFGKEQGQFETNNFDTCSVAKFKAFGKFLTYSLIEMNDSDALRLVEKFTSEIVKSQLSG